MGSFFFIVGVYHLAHLYVLNAINWDTLHDLQKNCGLVSIQAVLAIQYERPALTESFIARGFELIQGNENLGCFHVIGPLLIWTSDEFIQQSSYLCASIFFLLLHSFELRIPPVRDLCLVREE